MSKNIYVGNLPYKSSEAELRQLFEPFGQVNSAKVITDSHTGRSKGFAFVEMENPAEADAAIEKLNGTDLGGRKIVVNEARPKKDRDAR